MVRADLSPGKLPANRPLQGLCPAGERPSIREHGTPYRTHGGSGDRRGVPFFLSKDLPESVWCLHQRPTPESSVQKKAARADRVERNLRRERLSWGEQRELEALPQQVEKLSSEIAELERRLGDAGFYARDPKAFAIATQRLEQAARERATAEERWLELEEKRERLE